MKHSLNFGIYLWSLGEDFELFSGNCPKTFTWFFLSIGGLIYEVIRVDRKSLPSKSCALVPVVCSLGSCFLDYK